MSTRDTALENATEADDRAAVIAFLGGARGIGGRAETLPDLHDRMVKGFPLRSLMRFEKYCPQLVQDNAFARVLGLPAGPRTKFAHGTGLTINFRLDAGFRSRPVL